MKKFLLILMLCVPLGGCLTFQQVVDGASAAFTGVANPVTPQALYDTEQTMNVGFAVLRAYKKSCVAGALPASCRTVIAKIQVYTRQLPAELATVRAFVKNNDMVNAQLAYNTLLQLIADFKATATSNGVPI